MNTYTVKQYVDVKGNILCDKGVDLDIYETTDVICKESEVIVIGNGGGQIGDTNPIEILFNFKMTFNSKDFDKAARAFLRDNSRNIVCISMDEVEIDFLTPSKNRVNNTNDINKLLYEANQVVKYTGSSLITEIIDHIYGGQTGFIKSIVGYLKHQHKYSEIDEADIHTINDLKNYILNTTKNTSDDWLVQINVFEDSRYSSFTEDFVEFTKNINNEVLVALKGVIINYLKHLTIEKDAIYRIGIIFVKHT